MFASCVHTASQTFDGTPVDVLVLRFLQGRILVEEVCHKSHVEFWVPADNISCRDKLSAPETVCLVQHALGPFQVVLVL